MKDVTQCLIGREKEKKIQPAEIAWAYPMSILHRCYAGEMLSLPLALCTNAQISVTQVILLKASCQWQSCISSVTPVAEHFYFNTAVA